MGKIPPVFKSLQISATALDRWRPFFFFTRNFLFLSFFTRHWCFDEIHRCLIRFWSANSDDHNASLFIPIEPFSEPLCPVDMGEDMLDETTLIRMEMFHHRIKVISQRNLYWFAVPVSVSWCTAYAYMSTFREYGEGSLFEWLFFSTSLCFLLHWINGELMQCNRIIILFSLSLRVNCSCWRAEHIRQWYSHSPEQVTSCFCFFITLIKGHHPALVLWSAISKAYLQDVPCES